MSEEKVIQALAVCPAPRPQTWHVRMQSVSPPTYGTPEDIEAVLEQI